MEFLSRQATKLEWIGRQPGGCNKQAILIPLYNESNENFENRLNYFNNMAKEFKGELDVIIINDGSTDDSLERMKKYFEGNPYDLFFASVYPNANKVGALFKTVLSISNEFVILSDFDTDIEGIDKMLDCTDCLAKNESLMGCYFRMLPFEGSGRIFYFQQLEYSLARSLYKFHEKEGSIRVMPGAGSCYKRKVLISIYHSHSGLRSGEDREATLLGLKMGYKTFYVDNIVALTRPPLSFKGLVRQRIRWNLGYLETFYKEREYYCAEISRFTRMGIITLVDLFTFIFLMSLPLTLLFMCITKLDLLLNFLVIVYASYIIWCLCLFIVSPNESDEFRKKRLLAVSLFPIYKIAVEYFAWIAALWVFRRKVFLPSRSGKPVSDYPNELFKHMD